MGLPLHWGIAFSCLTDGDLRCRRGLSVTLRRPDGTLVTVPLRTDVQPWPPDFYTSAAAGSFTIPLASGAGGWRILTVQDKDSTYTENIDIRVWRDSTLTVSVSMPPNQPASATGVLKKYDAKGALVPDAGRVVHLRGFDANGGIINPAQTGTTDALGRYAITATLPGTVQQATAWSSARDVYAAANTASLATIDKRQETFLDGRAAPTSTTTACAGCLMSTFGHLRLRYTSGTIGPFSNQRVTVQVRVDGGAWTTVTTTGPTSTATGYFATRWPLSYARGKVVEVRAAYLSPYQSVRSVSLYLGKLTVT